jgi:hypothetical protein
MNKLENIKKTLTFAVGRGGLFVKKYSPEILMTVGVVGIVTSTVLACKATLKADEVLNETKSKLDRIHQAKEIGTDDKYPEEMYNKDLSNTYIQTGWEFVKLYGPSITLGAASIGCILGAHGIMRKRNLAVIAAYKTLEEGFTKYRKRVVDELGEEKDREFKYGIKKDSVVDVILDENGNEVDRVRKDVEVIDPNGISQYARIFDDTSVNWSETPEYNLMFLKCQQNYANDLLHSRGHLFLNEVYDMLGLKRSTEGAVVGWVVGQGDDFVDFGMYDTTVSGYVDDHANETIGEQRRDFVNGSRNAVLLDFNVAGVIYDMI